MSDTGTGVGTPIDPGTPPSDTPVIEWCSSAVRLHDYARIIGYPECGFFGVNNSDDIQVGCQHIWSWRQRDSLARYLCEAQEELEDVIHFKLSPVWITDELHSRSNPFLSRWNKVIASGIRAETDLFLNQAVSLVTDPCTIGPIATTETNEDEIHVYYPGTDQEIFPSKLQISGGNLTIWIPRCRIVNIDLIQTPEVGLDYADDSNFQSLVDIKRVYTDETDQGELVRPHVCSNSCIQCGCEEYTAQACIYIEDYDIGSMHAFLENTSSSTCCKFKNLRLNYYSGIVSPSLQMQDAIIRLAHSKMPSTPCGCDPITSVWERDREIPEALSTERVNCPFGQSDGAWIAWRFAHSIKQWRAFNL